MKPIALFRQIAYTIAALALVGSAISCSGKNDATPQTATPPPQLQPELTGTLPHDSTSFTQGLFFHAGILYESTGLYGKSTLRKLDTGGTVLLSRPLADRYFAEGCTFLGGGIYQITWRAQRCFVYSPDSLRPVDSLPYSGEGWGLTDNDTAFIMSNGSDTIYFRNNRFEVIRTLPVTSDGIPLERLNELEYARGYIYANVWYSDFIFEINPANGTVERIIDCSGLVAREHPASDEQVLNGIAYNPGTDRFYLTGKNWKHIYIVTIPES